MKKRYGKKLLSLRLATVMAASMLAACGGGQTAKETVADTETTAASTRTVGGEEKVTLKWYTDTNEIANETLYKAQDIADELVKQNPNVVIEIQPLVAATDTTNYLQKVDLMLVSDKQIDIVHSSRGSQAYQKVLSGLIIPSNNLAAERGTDLATGYTNSLALGEDYYTLAREDPAYIIFLNKQILDEVDLPIPPLDWIWEDHCIYAKALTKGEGLDKVYGSYSHTWDVMYQTGYLLDTLFSKEDGSSNFDDPSSGDFLQLCYDIEQEGVPIPLTEIKSQDMAHREMFFNDKVAMMFQDTWLLGDLKDIDKYPYDFETTSTSPPCLTKGQTPNITVGSGGSGYAIIKSCKHPQEAFDFIYFLAVWGADYSKSRISTRVRSDADTVAKTAIGEDESLCDFEAYRNVMDSIYQTQLSQFPEYNTDIIQVFSEECGMEMTEAQTIERTVADMVKRSNEIIDENGQDIPAEE